MNKLNWLVVIFSGLSAILLSFIIFPILLTIFSTPIHNITAELQNQEFLSALSLTLTAATIATSLTLITGIPLAYLLARISFRGKTIVESLVNLPIIVPHTAAGIALLFVFGRQGILGEILSKLGIVFLDSLPGIVVGMAFVSLPFLVTMSAESFRAVETDLEQAAWVDGASHWKTFWKVILPLSWRGVLSGTMMMWARGISEFGAVVILAYHPKTVPVLIFERFEGYGLSAGQTPAVILILVVFVIYIVVRSILLQKKSN